MKAGSLRRRVIITNLGVVVIVLVTVIAVVTLIYRGSLQHDIRQRLTTAANAVGRNWPGGGKQLVNGLALEGIAATIFGPSLPPADKMDHGRRPPTNPAASIHATASLLVLDQTLPNGARITYTASTRQIGNSVQRLLVIEIAVALAAVALATLLLTRAARAALMPLRDVADTARHIAAGNRTRRLYPDRTDTELGNMAVAFDEMVDALDAAIDRAENAESSMRDFLADASHELRTPIAALQCTIETLLREQPERPDRDDIEAAIARDAVRLGRLVNDLLTLTRPRDETTSTVPTDLTTVAVEAIIAANERATLTTIRLQAGPALPVNGDPEALGRLIRNLLDNALAVSASTITIETHRDDEDCWLSVSDNGPGVPATDRERIFRRFARLTNDGAGHGLGLAIARRIAEQHHGTLTCDPTRAHGARFTLRIPAAGPSQSPGGLG